MDLATPGAGGDHSTTALLVDIIIDIPTDTCVYRDGLQASQFVQADSTVNAVAVDISESVRGIFLPSKNQARDAP